jgi:hypothetical protein
MTSTTAKQVGRFQFDPSTSTVAGPADYMSERGSALLDAILNGTDRMFNASRHFSPDVVTAILVRLQTDYAAFAGQRQFDAAVRGGRS